MSAGARVWVGHAALFQGPGGHRRYELGEIDGGSRGIFSHELGVNVAGIDRGARARQLQRQFAPQPLGPGKDAFAGRRMAICAKSASREVRGHSPARRKEDFPAPEED